MRQQDHDPELLDYAIREEFKKVMRGAEPNGLPQFLHVGSDVYVTRELCTREQYERAIRLLLDEANEKTRVAHDLANEAVIRFQARASRTG